MGKKNSKQPILIVFSGLPGTGKTSISRSLITELSAIYVRIDTIEQALKQSSLKITDIEDAGYQVAYGLASDNLRVGKTVVADAANPLAASRNEWYRIAKAESVELVELEIHCSDRQEHQRRVETRRAGMNGLHYPTWQDVLEREYEDWNRDVLRIDTATNSVDDCVDLILKEIEK